MEGSRCARCEPSAAGDEEVNCVCSKSVSSLRARVSGVGSGAVDGVVDSPTGVSPSLGRDSASKTSCVTLCSWNLVRFPSAPVSSYLSFTADAARTNNSAACRACSAYIGSVSTCQATLTSILPYSLVRAIILEIVSVTFDMSTSSNVEIQSMRPVIELRHLEHT